MAANIRFTFLQEEMLIEKEKKKICPSTNIIKLRLTNTKHGINHKGFDAGSPKSECGMYTIFSNAQSQIPWSCYDTKGFLPDHREASLFNALSQHLVFYMYKVCY